jgi:D-alanyl-D-alanine carboxypeptidase/D-alanyl-D-alanine-endopeptidase (penicillin-binding protein 4)
MPFDTLPIPNATGVLIAPQRRLAEQPGLCRFSVLPGGNVDEWRNVPYLQMGGLHRWRTAGDAGPFSNAQVQQESRPMRERMQRVVRHQQKRRCGEWGWLGVALWAGLLVHPVRGQESGSSVGNAALSRRIESILATPGFRNGHWGILVVDRKSGQTVFERNPDQLFAPASVTKLFSAAAALIELGPNHRFGTPVVRHGEIDSEGVLHGDLILIAQGDVCMGGRTGPDGTLLFCDDDHSYAGGNLDSQVTPTDPLAGLDHLAREIQDAGVHEIAGEVIVDDRLFAAASSTGSGPRRVSPIVINDNVLDILAQPATKVGDPAVVILHPPTQFVTMEAQVSTVAPGQKTSLRVHVVGQNRIAVRGELPLGRSRVVKIREVEDPASFARALLIEALRRRGVRVGVSALGVNATSSLPPPAELAKLPKIAEYNSPPFREFIKVTLKVSHNLYASTLPLLLAAQHGERTLDAGLKRQGNVLNSLGVDPSGISFGGGAGGDRADFATPRATVTLLRAMASRPEFAAYDAALPVLGRDGTLAKAVSKDSPARGHAHAKTGTYFVDNRLTATAVLTSKALAGYLETAGGRSLVFAAFVNNVPLDAPLPNRTVSEATAAAGRLLGKLCEALYSDSAASVENPTRAAAGNSGARGSTN